MDVARGCLYCTEWGVLVGSSDDVGELSDVVSEYILFCEDGHPSKNSEDLCQPWATKRRREKKKKKKGKKEGLLNIKKRAFLKQDKEETEESMKGTESRD